MKRVLFTIFAVTILATSIACSNQQSTPAAQASPSTEQSANQSAAPVAQSDDYPVNDMSYVKSLGEYATAKNEALKRYTDRKAQALSEYTEIKRTASSEYYKFENAELLKLREANRQAYLDYLDAKKLGDYDWQKRLMTTVPAIGNYERVTDEKFKAYQKIDNDAFKRYQEKDNKAFKVYQTEEDAAYKAYKAYEGQQK